MKLAETLTAILNNIWTNHLQKMIRIVVELVCRKCQLKQLLKCSSYATILSMTQDEVGVQQRLMTKDNIRTRVFSKSMLSF